MNTFLRRSLRVGVWAVELTFFGMWAIVGTDPDMTVTPIAVIGLICATLFLFPAIYLTGITLAEPQAGPEMTWEETKKLAEEFDLKMPHTYYEDIRAKVLEEAEKAISAHHVRKVDKFIKLQHELERDMGWDWSSEP